jgi:hypothetical protein
MLATPKRRTPATARVEGDLAAPRPTPPASPTADDLVRKAQQAWIGGQPFVAIGQARAALKATPNPAQALQAYEIIGICACDLGEASAAREALSHLSSARRETVKSVCEKNKVKIE